MMSSYRYYRQTGICVHERVCVDVCACVLACARAHVCAPCGNGFEALQLLSIRLNTRTLSTRICNDCKSTTIVNHPSSCSRRTSAAAEVQLRGAYFTRQSDFSSSESALTPGERRLTFSNEKFRENNSIQTRDHQSVSAKSVHTVE
jgi:hypothetical protein